MNKIKNFIIFALIMYIGYLNCGWLRNFSDNLLGYSGAYLHDFLNIELTEDDFKVIDKTQFHANGEIARERFILYCEPLGLYYYVDEHGNITGRNVNFDLSQNFFHEERASIFSSKEEALNVVSNFILPKDLARNAINGTKTKRGAILALIIVSLISVIRFSVLWKRHKFALEEKYNRDET